jgi:hypothetical protein
MLGSAFVGIFIDHLAVVYQEEANPVLPGTFKNVNETEVS